MTDWPTTPRLELAVDGQIYAGWTRATVTRGLEQVPAQFLLSVTERWATRSAPWVIAPGSRCTLTADGETVIDGWVDVYAPEIGPEQHTVRIEGRSLAADLVDCSAVVSGGQFRGYTLDAIARTLAEPFGIGVAVDADLGEPFPEVQIQQGETCFDLIERLSVLRGCLVGDDPAGRLVFRQVGGGEPDGAIVLAPPGKPVTKGAARAVSGRASLGHQDRYSEVIVKAQRSGSDQVSGAAASAVAARARDPKIVRHRPLLLVADAQAGPADARARADWEVRRRAGQSTSAELTIVGWRRPDGRLWDVGQLEHVQAPDLGLARDLVISDVALSLTDEGSAARLKLAPPAAFTPAPLDPDAEQTSAGGAAGGGQWDDVVPIG